MERDEGRGEKGDKGRGEDKWRVSLYDGGIYAMHVRLLHLELVYLVTALVPSLTACLANFLGSNSHCSLYFTRSDRQSFVIMS